jgi:redox-sensitive bicupin YhaK (pirin superfamily)
MRRRLARVVVTPPPAPGFIGEGHQAVEVLGTEDLDDSDPFVLLMDDRLAIANRRQIGGAHPHAGLETVTLVLDGTVWDRDEGDISTGDLIWMTAGRGIVHSEHIEAEGKARILQLWIRLPARDRMLAPRFERVLASAVPVRREPGARARVYSGASGGVQSTTQNRVPITLIDVELEPGATFEQDLPVSYIGFFYVIDGEVSVEKTRVEHGGVGWLDRPRGQGTSTLTFVAGARGARLVLYTGEPQHAPLVHHGPFVAGSPHEIKEYYARFRAGEFEFMSAIARRQRSNHAQLERSRP